MAQGIEAAQGEGVTTVRLTRKGLQAAAKHWKMLYLQCVPLDMTFRQMRGLFIGQHGYTPPENIPYMPTCPMDWFRYIRDVPAETLWGSPAEV